MPFIRGITDISTPRSANWATDQTGIAPVNPEAIERYGHEFTGANPLNGLLSRESVTSRHPPGF